MSKGEFMHVCEGSHPITILSKKFPIINTDNKKQGIIIINITIKQALKRGT